jgi:simple sugar transport system ATP-binding protein
MMVGREVQLDVDKNPAQLGETVLKVTDLIVTDDQKQITVDEVSLSNKSGEILGIAGVQGNGQTELVEAITGLRKPVSGKIEILNQDTTNATPRQVTELGVAHVPEDRQRDGLVLSFPIYENLVLNTYYLPPHAKGVSLDYDRIYQDASQLIEDFDVRTPSSQTPAGSLSGGNQQKVIIARELSRPIQLLVASQPTRGLDVGSIEYIHNRILEKRDAGCAVLLVSPELDEIMSLADRIAVMYRDKIIAVLNTHEVTKEEVGLWMAGIDPNEQKKSNREHAYQQEI